MNIVVFDDSLEFCQQISVLIDEFFIRNFPKFNINIAVFAEEKDFWFYLKDHEPEIIFLDIATPSDDNFGIKIGRKLRDKYEKVHLIFITSHNEKLVEVLEALIRPTQFFAKPIQKDQLEQLLRSLLKQITNSQEYMVVKSGHADCLLNIQDIYYIRKKERKTSISLLNRQLEIRDSVAKLAEQLPANFIKVDKGVIVNLKKVQIIDYAKSYLILENEERIIISKTAKKNLRELLEAFAEGNKNALLT